MMSKKISYTPLFPPYLPLTSHPQLDEGLPAPMLLKKQSSKYNQDLITGLSAASSSHKVKSTERYVSKRTLHAPKLAHSHSQLTHQPQPHPVDGMLESVKKVKPVAEKSDFEVSMEKADSLISSITSLVDSRKILKVMSRGGRGLT